MIAAADVIKQHKAFIYPRGQVRVASVAHRPWTHEYTSKPSADEPRQDEKAVMEVRQQAREGYPIKVLKKAIDTIAM